MRYNTCITGYNSYSRPIGNDSVAPERVVITVLYNMLHQCLVRYNNPFRGCCYISTLSNWRAAGMDSK